MNRDPFLRLALIVAVTVWLVAIAVVWKMLGWPWAVVALVGGPGGALVLTVERTAPVEGDDTRRRWRQPRDGTRGFERIQ